MCAEAISLSLQMEFISGSRWDLRVDIKLLKVRFYFNCLLGEEFQISISFVFQDGEKDFQNCETLLCNPFFLAFFILRFVPFLLELNDALFSGLFVFCFLVCCFLWWFFFNSQLVFIFPYRKFFAPVSWFIVLHYISALTEIRDFLL